jgi:hypothetical protein
MTSLIVGEMIVSVDRSSRYQFAFDLVTLTKMVVYQQGEETSLCSLVTYSPVEDANLSLAAEDVLPLPGRFRRHQSLSLFASGSAFPRPQRATRKTTTIEDENPVGPRWTCGNCGTARHAVAACIKKHNFGFVHGCGHYNNDRHET